MARFLLPVVLILAPACRNACQRVCVRMASYAEECGYVVPDDQLAACIEDQAQASDRSVCREFGAPEAIRQEWSCDDLADYWANDEAAPAASSGSPTDG